MNTFVGQRGALGPQFEIKGIIFDVDDTLTVRTPEHARIWGDAFWATTNHFNSNHGMTREQHDLIKLDAYKREGTAHRHLAELCGVDEYAYFSTMYKNAGRLPVTREDEMVDYFSRHHRKIPFIALTSGLYMHANKILADLGIADYLRIMDLRDTNGLLKSKGPEAWLMAAEKLGVDPKNILIVEDNFENARQAKLAGMSTSIVHHGKEPDDKPDYIHYWLPKAHHAFDLIGK